MVAHITDSPRYPLNISCHSCDILYTVYVDPNDYMDWCSGDAFIQDIMPYLSDGERELLLTNTCGGCFDKMFDN